MAEEAQYASGTESTPHKRKYEDSSAAHRPTGFSAPIASPSPENAHAPPPSYNSVPPPPSGIELAKQRAQEVAARLLNNVSSGPGAFDAKRPKVDNGASGFDSQDSKPQYSAPSSAPISYAYQGSSKKIDIPNGRVGVIIGKGGETIKYLQTQSGAKIQVTRDMDADLNSPTRMVELMGTPSQIATAERLINEVLAEAETGGSGIVARRLTGQAGGSEQFVMKIPNNKVGLIIGKGGETIKNMQAQSGARIQVIPLHLPPGDTSTERTLQIDGTSEQIESAKQLVDQVISENRLRNPSMSASYPQQGYQARPHSSWAPPGAPMQQPSYGYGQPGGYSGPSAQYSMPQPPYPGYPPQPSGGYSTSWDQSSVPPAPHSTQGSGYDYYSQQQNPGPPAPAADGSAYNYSQPPPSGYNQPGQGYAQDSYGGYHTSSQSGYGQPQTYDQQQGYSSAPSYGTGSNPTQEGHTPSYGSQGDSTQAPPSVQPGQQGYGTNPQPSPNYPPQGTGQPGYGVPPTSQAAYGNQVQGYGPGYGAPQSQKPGGNTPVYGQSTQSPSTAGGYGQPGYPPSQPPPGYAQPESGPQRAPPSGYGYGQPPPYGAPPAGQPGYGQAPSSYSNTYATGYGQPPAYASDVNAGGTPRGASDGAPVQTVQQGGVAKASPQS